MTNDLLYQIALTSVNNIGAVQAKLLLKTFGTAEAIFKAPKRILETIEGIGEVKAASIKNFDDFKLAEEEIAFLQKYKIQPILLNDATYPQRLLQCYDAPAILYYRGSADLNTQRVVSVIGTRNNTDYGRQVTEQLVTDLQPYKPLVVSGLAYGIDAIAHKAALQNELPTVGVLAHGLSKIYPNQHAQLAKRILSEQGGLLTEFTSETAPDRHNFPRRNRIVAGLAECTIVVETAIKGGSMITAELANGYNRNVFAIPGKISDAKSAGCNHLIKNGKATLLESVAQLATALGWNTKTKKKKQAELFVELSADEQLLVNILKEKTTVHVDELFIKSGLSSSSVAAAVLNLEFQNVVESLPGKLYKLL